MKHKTRKNPFGLTGDIAEFVLGAGVGLAGVGVEAILLDYTGLPLYWRAALMGATGIAAGIAVTKFTPYKTMGVGLAVMPVGAAITYAATYRSIVGRLEDMIALTARQPSGLPVSRDAYFGTAGLPLMSVA